MALDESGYPNGDTFVSNQLILYLCCWFRYRHSWPLDDALCLVAHGSSIFTMCFVVDGIVSNWFTYLRIYITQSSYWDILNFTLLNTCFVLTPKTFLFVIVCWQNYPIQSGTLNDKECPFAFGIKFLPYEQTCCTS